MNLNQIKTDIKNRLNQYLKEVESTSIFLKTEIEISSKDFRTKEGVEKIINQIDNQTTPIIYRFSIESEKERKELLEIYRKYHLENKEKLRGVDRRNISRFNDTNSKTLYLGSKMSKPRPRIRQHLGEGYFRTFSLDLNKWDLDFDYNLKLEIFDIQSNLESGHNRSFIELLEQELWEQELPVFGKKSGL